MKNAILALTLALLVAGCAPSARTVRDHAAPFVRLTSTSPYPAFKAAIDTLLPDTLFPPANVALKIVSLEDDAVLYELNPHMQFNPASNEKLFTSAAALTLLGESFPLTTVLGADTSTATLYLKGCGDPLLSTADLDSLARAIGPLLPPKTSWKLVYDESFFDANYWGEGWGWDDEPSYYQPFLTPLILNNNTVTVRAQAGAAPGDSVRVTVDPPTSFVTVVNSGRTVADTAVNPLRISRKPRDTSNSILISGDMVPGNKGAREVLTVWDPGRYTATVFAELLRSRNVTVSTIVADTIPPYATEVMRYSHRLDSAVTFLNKESDNLTAETLLKLLARENRGVQGSAGVGVSVLYTYLSSIGIDTMKIAIVDGSGLSRMNLTSASAITRVLTTMYYDRRHANTFLSSLPIAGVDGTLANRMKGTPAAGNLRAKTGTLSGVTALSGYVMTADGKPLAFSMMMQNFSTSSRDYRLAQDRIGAFLAGLKLKDL
jgi:D-alanyl-D-alanine carboxypeptidase/D-alanyl-D-alanine-endopeptidase (penicillin-binding protein 4)